MRLHRFFITEDLGKKEIVLRDESLLHQLFSVFRYGVGDRVIFFDGMVHERIFSIKQSRKKEAVFEFIEEVKPKPESSVELTLYLSLLKRENFELAIEKATELGVFRVVPLRTERTVKQGLNESRLRKLIQEATEQSGRFKPLELSEIKTLEDALHETEGLRVFAHPSGESIFSSKKIAEQKKLSLWIGPEGGWTDEEVSLAGKVGCFLGTLGNSILRAETAAISGSFALLHLHEKES